MSEFIECGFCHSQINPETKETIQSKDSKAMNISSMKRENEKLEKHIEGLNNLLTNSQIEVVKLRKEVKKNAKKPVTKPKTTGKKPEKEPEPEPKQTPEQRKKGFLTWLHGDN